MKLVQKYKFPHSIHQATGALLGFVVMSLFINGFMSGCGSSNGTGSTPSSLVVTIASPSPGPSYIPIGGTSVQYKVTQVNTDGSTSDVSTSATWSSSNKTAAPITTAGLVTSGAVGGFSTISAVVGTLTGTSSLPVTGLVTTITVGTNPSWAVVRPGGLEVWVSNNGTNTVSVISTATNAVTNTITVGNGPAAIVFTLDGTKAYVANGTDLSISIINATTKAVTSTLTSVSTDFDGELALSPDGTKVYVPASMSGLKKIVTATDAISVVLAGTCPQGATFLPNGTAYVAYQCTNAVTPFNTSDAAQTTIAGANQVWQTIYASPDGSKIFANSGGSVDIKVYRTSDNTLTETLTDSGGWSFFSDSKRAIWGLETTGLVYKTYDYTTTPITAIDTLSFQPPARTRVGITSTNTLYLPVRSSSLIKVYQYH